jgi:competence protein ComEC
MDLTWFLAVAGGSFWLGILLRGVGAHASSAGRGVLGIAAGSALLVAGVWVARGMGRSPPGRIAVPGRVLLVSGAVAFLLFGMARTDLAEARIRASPLTRLQDRTVELVGSFANDPAAGRLGWHAVLAVARVSVGVPAGTSSLPVDGAVWLQGYGPPPAAVQGDRVLVTGLLRAPTGGFATFLGQRGIASTCSIGELRRLGPSTNPVRRVADAVRAALRRSLARVFPSRDGGLLLGLALGDTSRLDPTIEDQFRATGLSHLTAVSGENVAMFLAPILGLLSWLEVGRHTRFVVGLAAVAFFVTLTRAEPSVLRAAAMTGLAMLGVFLGRPRTPAAILGGSVLLLLAVDPWLVYSIGFQLSVAATAGMALLSEPLSERLSFLPNGLRVAAATSLGAQAGVTPLLLYHFGVVPGVTLPANLLAFPAVGPGMVLGLGAAALGVASRPLGLALAGLARMPLAYLEDLASHLARSPLPSLTAGQGELAQLIGGLVLTAMAAAWLRRRFPLPRDAAMAAGLAITVVLSTAAVRAGPPRWLTVTFFSVGWGDAALVRSPGGATVLIDGGPDAQLVATDLARLGVHRLDAVVATHPHADHVTGIPAVLARFPVRVVLDPGCRASSPFYDAFLAAVRRSGVPMRHPRASAAMQVGDLRIDVLAPSRCFHGTASDLNNDSLVLRISDGRRVVLFGGDAQQESQEDLLKAPGLLAAPLVKWFHHGGNTNDPASYRAIHASLAIICTGPNLYHDPSPHVLRALASAGVRVLRTDLAGDITVELRADGLHVESRRA